jgi:CheY-like chemotaxis protein
MATVLIVEDDPMNFRVFSKILTKRGGLSVLGTEDVEEILQLTSTGQVDIVLIDVSLCRSVYEGKAVDGIRITQLLKSNPQTAPIPVILVTAHAMEGDRELFLANSGANGYIAKPVVDHENFVSEVKKAISETGE